MALSTDLRHAARLLARNPIFTATAVVSIAIGIAATSTVYSLVDALLVAPSPGLRHPETLVDVGRANAGRWFDNMTHPAFTHLRDHTRTLSGLAAVEFGGGPMSLGVDGSSERVFSMLVSASYFEVLGTRTAIGRFFLPQEDEVADRTPSSCCRTPSGRGGSAPTRRCSSARCG
jgi:hypothetical protein